ncbi:hypothetical protein CRE_22253 [Caenorhabditis remanei]|uniref:Uncharacterized protein n=1 Tax=Caenorhabditis remanei TaxID=31234 RepID=E3NU52_CAERE|nr:hypothetical protein CRE_22253 [Caenorhabditis remanei]
MAARLIIHSDFLHKVLRHNRNAIGHASARQINILVEIVYNLLNTKNIPLSASELELLKPIHPQLKTLSRTGSVDKARKILYKLSKRHSCRDSAPAMKLIRKYHIVPYEDGSAVESAKRFLETILNDPTLETSEKCRFYQDLLYRIRQHRELPIMTDEVFDDLRDTYSQQNSNNEASAGAVAVPTLKRELAVVVPKIEKQEPEEPMDEDDDDLKELPAVFKRVKTESADNAYQQQQPTARRLSRKRLHVDVDDVEDNDRFETTMKQRRVAAATLELPSPPVRTSRKRKILDNVKKQKLNIVQPTRPSPPPLLPPPPPTNQRRPPKRRHPILHSKIPEKRRKFVELFDPTGGKLPVWRVRKDYRFAPYQTERSSIRLIFGAFYHPVGTHPRRLRLVLSSK